jgi:hypothetical protein
MLRISVAAVVLGGVCGFGAETNVAKVLFVVRVEALRSTTEAKSETTKTKDSAAVKDEREEFVLETPSEETSVEVRAQQIEAMNGAPIMRVGGKAGTSGGSRGVGRALDFLLPKGSSLLSRNPNARRNPLRMLEE